MSEPLSVAVTNAARQPGLRTETQRQDAVTETLRRIGVTVTEVLLEPVRIVKLRMQRALLGMRIDESSGLDLPSGKPVMRSVKLRSVVTRCAECAGPDRNDCGRRGLPHDIDYKTGQVEGNAKELRRAASLNGTANLYERVEVDPETGDFELPVLEAIKVLKQFGQHIQRPGKVGVIEPAYEAKYGNQQTNSEGRPRKPTVIVQQ